MAFNIKLLTANESYYNKTKSIGVSEADYSCIWFLNSGIINGYQ